MYIFIRACSYIYIFICTCICICICINIFMCACVCVCVSEYVCLCMYMCVRVLYTFVDTLVLCSESIHGIYVCTCVCICTRVCSQLQQDGAKKPQRGHRLRRSQVTVFCQPFLCAVFAPTPPLPPMPWLQHPADGVCAWKKLDLGEVAGDADEVCANEKSQLMTGIAW